jgi:hypothetical protein
MLRTICSTYVASPATIGSSSSSSVSMLIVGSCDASWAMIPSSRRRSSGG